LGKARTWSYAYNGFGQVLSVTGPRNDIRDVTTYTYDNYGNLTTAANALGHTTKYSKYDNSGRVGQIVNPNGLTTDIAYDVRGRVVSYTVSDGVVIEVTHFDYDRVGQLSKATFPNGTLLSYTYDPAHRLTNVTDSNGNSVTYTLDNVGNRISEKTAGPDGLLARQITRLYDALGNIRQVTGSAQ
jgi:YD repeat-containing protein